MGIFSGKQKYWVLGACSGILVLSGALCAILLSGKETGIAQSLPQDSIVPTVTSPTAHAETNIVVGTPEVDLIEEQRRKEIEAVTIRTIMLPGTTVYGVDVGGMSREQAKAAVEEKLSQDPPIVNLLFADGKNIYHASGEQLINSSAQLNTVPEDDDDDAVDPALKAAEDNLPDDEPSAEILDNTPIGIKLDYDIDNAINVAFSLMRDKNIAYDDFISQVKEIASGKEVAPPPSYNIDSVNRYVSYLSDILDTPATNASVSMDNNQIVYTDEANGHGIDQSVLISSILNSDPFSNDTIDIPMHELVPSITKEMLQSKYVKRGQGYTTSFSDSTKNRKYNIRYGAEKINGTILKPGDVFSANETLGKRTRSNGWKNAGAYEGGEVVQQAGGGVCQLSSTLYNAVLYADLEIVERRNHSMPVHYVNRGRDATINSVGNIIDFKFRNNTSSDIIIIAYTVGNNLNMEIYGVPFETDEYDRIEIRTKQTGSTSIKTEYTYDNNKPTSYKKTTSNGSKGYTVRTYKDYYKGDVRVKTDDLGVSSYKMFPKKVTVGTIEESHSSGGSSSSSSSGDSSNNSSSGDSGSSSSSASSGDSGSSGSSGGDSGSNGGSEQNGE